jgi:hypothetical protein
MTNYLYYPNSSSSLVDIGNSVCGAPMDDNIKGKLLLANNHIKQPDKRNFNNTPVILPGAANSHCSLPMCTDQEHKRLSTLSNQVGGPATIALAELVDELKIQNFAGDMNTFGGNGIGAAAQASGFMVKDVANYDHLLKEYYDLKNHRAAPATIIRKESELERAFKKMNDSLNRRGQQILRRHASKTKKVLTQTGKVGREPIPISDQQDAQRLAKLAKFGKVAGPGFILLDGYLRYDKVSNMYKQNNPQWKRETVIQSASFATGIMAGATIVFLIGAAPLGLVVGIVAAGAAAVVADKLVTGAITKVYDSFAN